jgi:hypothetical protein
MVGTLGDELTVSDRATKKSRRKAIRSSPADISASSDHLLRAKLVMSRRPSRRRDHAHLTSTSGTDVRSADKPSARFADHVFVKKEKVRRIQGISP